MTAPQRDEISDRESTLERERVYYDQLYSGFAQHLFARPAVAAFRRDLARNIVERAGIAPPKRVLSLGCGIGDTELLLAPHAGEIVGVDLSNKAVEHARERARQCGAINLQFTTGEWQSAIGPGERFDAVLGIFFLHHLTGPGLAELPAQLAGILRPGGVVYALEPSHRRLSEKVGKLLFPAKMRKFQTEDERALDGEPVAASFRQAGFAAATLWYDFGSLPLAGMCPGWAAAYRVARRIDDVLIRTPGLKQWSNAFELVARLPR